MRVLKSLSADFEGNVLDFGAGSGELCQQIARQFPQARIVCYEPVPSLYEEATDNLSDCPGVQVVNKLADISVSYFDYIFCLEVLEHLPRPETAGLLDAILIRSTTSTTVTFGVPNEIHAAALAKGLFRFRRRRGSFDARWSHIWKAAMGHPPRHRPTSEIWPGLRYHYHHLGFDHRLLRRTLERRFDVLSEYGSPLTWLPTALNSEVYFVCQPKEGLAVPACSATPSPMQIPA